MAQPRLSRVEYGALGTHNGACGDATTKMKLNCTNEARFLGAIVVTINSEGDLIGHLLKVASSLNNYIVPY